MIGLHRGGELRTYKHGVTPDAKCAVIEVPTEKFPAFKADLLRVYKPQHPGNIDYREIRLGDTTTVTFTPINEEGSKQLLQIAQTMGWIPFEVEQS